MIVTDHFKGTFVSSAESIADKLNSIKAFIFDWDGVFNPGFKDAEGRSPFSEVDAMGTNLLRFNSFLRQKSNPLVAIISGEHNKTAQSFAQRESIHAVYSGIKFKADALKHFTEEHRIKAEEVAFFFDDVLDLSAARECGLRFMVGRSANPLMTGFAVSNNMVDYLTECSGANGAVRECVELITGLSGTYNETMQHRIDFSQTYQGYLKVRNETKTKFFLSKEGQIISE